jgi:hypothetical protein
MSIFYILNSVKLVLLLILQRMAPLAGGQHPRQPGGEGPCAGPLQRSRASAWLGSVPYAIITLKRCLKLLKNFNLKFLQKF